LITPSLSLSEEDKKDIQWLLARGVTMETRALPNDEKKSVKEFLN